MDETDRQHSYRNPQQALLRGIQDRIKAIPQVASCLRQLRTKGLRSNKVLKCAATLVLIESTDRWRRDPQTRINANNWRLLAKRLKNMAKDVEHLYRTDSKRPDGLNMSLGLAWLEQEPQWHDPQHEIAAIMQLAADLETKANLAGQVRKAIVPWIKRGPEVALLRHVLQSPDPKIATKRSPKQTPWREEHSRERLRDLFWLLAELLDEAYKACGLKARFSADSLDKTYKRHILPNLRR